MKRIWLVIAAAVATAVLVASCANGPYYDATPSHILGRDRLCFRIERVSPDADMGYFCRVNVRAEQGS